MRRHSLTQSRAQGRNASGPAATDGRTWPLSSALRQHQLPSALSPDALIDWMIVSGAAKAWAKGRQGRRRR